MLVFLFFAFCFASKKTLWLAQVGNPKQLAKGIPKQLAQGIPKQLAATVWLAQIGNPRPSTQAAKGWKIWVAEIYQSTSLVTSGGGEIWVAEIYQSTSLVTSG